MGLTMIDLFCDSFERVPQRIVLDIDDTPDAVHGGQQLALWTLLTKVATSCDRILIAGGANVEAEWEQGPAV